MTTTKKESGKNPKWQIPYSEMYGLLDHIRHETDYLPDDLYEWINRVLNNADELAYLAAQDITEEENINQDDNN